VLMKYGGRVSRMWRSPTSPAKGEGRRRAGSAGANRRFGGGIKLVAPATTRDVRSPEAVRPVAVVGVARTDWRARRGEERNGGWL
jgi:hypothetical protein